MQLLHPRNVNDDSFNAKAIDVLGGVKAFFHTLANLHTALFDPNANNSHSISWAVMVILLM